MQMLLNIFPPLTAVQNIPSRSSGRSCSALTASNNLIHDHSNDRGDGGGGWYGMYEDTGRILKSPYVEEITDQGTEAYLKSRGYGVKL
jgi:hypothetical protein